jgi:hypothetical protein
MAFVTLDEKLLVVSSTDGLVKIFSLKGAVKAIFNVNHPLPLVWDVSFERTEEKRRKVIYALKIIDVLQKSGDAGFNISSSVS